MRRVPPTYRFRLPDGTPITSQTEHRIPACGKCGDDLVRWRGKWVCRKCFTFAELESNNMLDKGIPLIERFPNRTARSRYR